VRGRCAVGVAPSSDRVPIRAPCGVAHHPHTGTQNRWNSKPKDGSVANASYVWLPLESTGGNPPGFKLKWVDQWRLGDYKPTAPSDS